MSSTSEGQPEVGVHLSPQSCGNVHGDAASGQRHGPVRTEAFELEDAAHHEPAAIGRAAHVMNHDDAVVQEQRTAQIGDRHPRIGDADSGIGQLQGSGDLRRCDRARDVGDEQGIALYGGRQECRQGPQVDLGGHREICHRVIAHAHRAAQRHVIVVVSPVERRDPDSTVG